MCNFPPGVENDLLYTCFGGALSLLFGRSMSELGLKEADRGGPKSDADLSLFGEHWVPTV